MSIYIIGYKLFVSVNQAEFYDIKNDILAHNYATFCNTSVKWTHATRTVTIKLNGYELTTNQPIGCSFSYGAIILTSTGSSTSLFSRCQRNVTHKGISSWVTKIYQVHWSLGLGYQTETEQYIAQGIRQKEMALQQSMIMRRVVSWNYSSEVRLKSWMLYFAYHPPENYQVCSACL